MKIKASRTVYVFIPFSRRAKWVVYPVKQVQEAFPTS